mgnify:CR=1 FL=1
MHRKILCQLSYDTPDLISTIYFICRRVKSAGRQFTGSDRHVSTIIRNFPRSEEVRSFPYLPRTWYQVPIQGIIHVHIIIKQNWPRVYSYKVYLFYVQLYCLITGIYRTRSACSYKYSQYSNSLEGPVINAHSMQVARFLFIDSHTRKGRGTPPKIVEPLNFAPLRYSLNSCLHRR